MTELIEPDWPAPMNIRAISTTRLGGFSRAPYDSLNLADHVGDEVAAVRANRRALMTGLNAPHSQPVWLNQVHGTACVAAESIVHGATADAAVTRK